MNNTCRNYKVLSRSFLTQKKTIFKKKYIFYIDLILDNKFHINNIFNTVFVYYIPLTENIKFQLNKVDYVSRLKNQRTYWNSGLNYPIIIEISVWVLI